MKQNGCHFRAQRTRITPKRYFSSLQYFYCCIVLSEHVYPHSQYTPSFQWHNFNNLHFMNTAGIKISFKGNSGTLSTKMTSILLHHVPIFFYWRNILPLPHLNEGPSNGAKITLWPPIFARSMFRYHSIIKYLNNRKDVISNHFIGENHNMCIIWLIRVYFNKRKKNTKNFFFSFFFLIFY